MSLKRFSRAGLVALAGAILLGHRAERPDVPFVLRASAGGDKSRRQPTAPAPDAAAPAAPQPMPDRRPATASR